MINLQLKNKDNEDFRKQSIEIFNLFECSKIKNIAFLVPVILSCNPKIKHFLFY